MSEQKEYIPIPKPEVQQNVEAAPIPEQTQETPKPVQEQATPQTPSQPTPAQQAPVQSVNAADPVVLEIENILAEGMESFFMSLSPQKQLEFKTTGEAAARTIKQTIQKGGATLKDIVSIIVGWLKTLPGLNKYFLEQEAKIKADKILHAVNNDSNND